LERKRRNPKEQRRHQQSDGSKGASAPSTGFGREVKRVKRGDDSGRKENSSIELVEKGEHGKGSFQNKFPTQNCYDRYYSFISIGLVF
jgi:hypothetical protein